MCISTKDTLKVTCTIHWIKKKMEFNPLQSIFSLNFIKDFSIHKFSKIILPPFFKQAKLNCWHPPTHALLELYRSYKCYALWISINQLCMSVRCSHVIIQVTTPGLCSLYFPRLLRLSKRIPSRQKMQPCLVKYWHAAPVVTLWLW